MSRDLAKSERNALTIQDARSGTPVKFFYKTPTAKQEVAYHNSLYQFKGNQLRFNATETRINFALEIITGFADDAFTDNGKPISSEKGKPGYREDWKEMLKDTASDLLNLFSLTIFEGSRVGGEVVAGGEGGAEANFPK